MQLKFLQWLKLKGKKKNSYKDTPQYLIVGLGNPGLEYTYTRHNFGFLAVDFFADKMGVSFDNLMYEGALTPVFSVDNAKVVLLKPLTYMNMSGKAVKEVALRYNISSSKILVIYDDVSLPFGKLRLRAKGSAGGHKGMASVIYLLGTESIPRLRLGIKNSERINNLKDFVLSEFNKAELEMLPEILEKAADAIKLFITEGIERAMGVVNSW